jgi:hypothetical protein
MYLLSLLDEESTTLTTSLAMDALPVAFVALVVALALKQVPMRGLAQAGARDIGRGFGMPDQRSSQEQLEEQIVRILRTKLPLVAPNCLLNPGLAWTQCSCGRSVRSRSISIGTASLIRYSSRVARQCRLASSSRRSTTPSGQD